MTFTSMFGCCIIIFNLMILIWGNGAFSKVEELKKSNFLDLYAVYITDGDVDNLMAHCKSGDDDLGDKKLTPNQYFHWMFRQNFFLTTVFTCTYRWMAPDNTELKSVTFNAFDIEISILCGDEYSINRCYWLVRKDGFYFSRDDQKPFPDGWKLMHTW
ncbi:plant self-incompatibility protein S1 family [Artemisia annua]|uniref:S-protein homolog n=1 Tax=Artemisia annua TaxID=35608 RepID=A0A2U1NP35_ARTAN|nr:plant self-incompatibility protein S1 family [Artemisia annua]